MEFLLKFFLQPTFIASYKNDMMMEVQIKQRILVVSFSVLIVTHGREELLMKCLDSLRPDGVSWQLILLANGQELSSDLITKAQSLTPHFTQLHSESQLSPGKARNMALHAIEGEWVYFVDDDAMVLPGYWELALPLLNDARIDILGGPDSPAPGMNTLSLSLALALSSPFCTGATFSRHKSFGKKLRPADEETLTSCNLWVRRSALQHVAFPEDYIRAEETVFLQKLKSLGLGMYYHPKLKVAHFRRSRLMHLWRPTFYAGFYRSKLMKEKLKKGNEAFWLPTVFVLLHFLIFLEPVAFWYLARMYGSVITFVSIGIAMRARRFWLFPMIAFLHYFIVFMYGVGFLSERFRRIK
jgi:GT2 family glycosyltransferase